MRGAGHGVEIDGPLDARLTSSAKDADHPGRRSEAAILSRQQFHVRVARRADAAAIHALESRVFTTDRLSLRSIRRLIAVNSARVLVSADRSEIAAALAMLYRRGSTHARLYSLAVDPRFRARGMGSRLLSRALVRARRDGKSEMRLEVRRDNRLAQSFYVRQGFTKTGLRENYYQDGQTAFVYAMPTGRLELHDA